MTLPGPALNETHDPRRRSWVEGANGPGDFPIQNLPFGLFQREGEEPRGGVAIGDRIFDLRAGAVLFDGPAARAAWAASEPTLASLIALGPEFASALRLALSRLLAVDRPEAQVAQASADRLLIPAAAAQMLLPLQFPAFTDMMCSSYHVAGGRRGEPVVEPPGWFKTVPLGYNARASSVRVSKTPVVRPRGVHANGAGRAVFGAEPRQDYELELGVVIGTGNELGDPIEIAAAPAHVFGYCLLNDWSARGIQFLEMTPLGPFLGKSFATTVSPWIVTAEALAPFAVAAYTRSPSDPALLPHLLDANDQAAGGLDLRLEAWLSTARMRETDAVPELICDTNFRHMYWTVAQMVTHHASGGCGLSPGDLIGSGTISGPGDAACGCLWERTAGGQHPFALSDGTERLYLEDGDEIVLRGRAEREGFAPIGFGECRAELRGQRRDFEEMIG